MIRKLVARFNRSLTEKIVAPRKSFQVPVRIWFEPCRNTGPLAMGSGRLTVSGETKDLSTSGIGFIVPSIRIQENYLVGEGRILNAEIDLPEGRIRMQVIGQRYEQVGQHISTARYLIGAKIVKISDEHREVYEYFLKHGIRRRKRNLALGIDKG